MPPAAAQTAILAFATEAAKINELDDIESVMRLYRSKILRYVMFALNDTDAAESITQDTFLKAYNARASFRGDCALSTWLISIAANLVRDHTRTQKFRFWKNVRNTAADVTEMAHMLSTREGTVERSLMAKEQVANVQQAMEKLSPRQRSVFLMRFMEEMDLSEIAHATGMPVATVKTHLHRAVIAVRAQLKEANSNTGGTR